MFSKNFIDFGNFLYTFLVFHGFWEFPLYISCVSCVFLQPYCIYVHIVSSKSIYLLHCIRMSSPKGIDLLHCIRLSSSKGIDLLHCIRPSSSKGIDLLHCIHISSSKGIYLLYCIHISSSKGSSSSAHCIWARFMHKTHLLSVWLLGGVLVCNGALYLKGCCPLSEKEAIECLVARWSVCLP